MAFDPATFFSLLLGPLLGGLGQGMSTQERQSFAGHGGGTDPSELLAGATGGLRDLGAAFQDRARKGITLRSSYVQPTPTFTGGGLPFPIGVTARDPALSDPSLLHLDGLNFGASSTGGGLFGGGTGRVTPVAPGSPSTGGTDGHGNGPDGFPSPTLGNSEGTDERRTRAASLPGIARRDVYSGTGAAPNDISQAISALRLLGGGR